MNPVYANVGATIFEHMSGLARENGAINLGQGFPDGRGPEDVLAAAADALLTQSNQYPPMAGLPLLREAVAGHYARHHGLPCDPAEEVIVTSGATEAIAAAILALVSPGDEVLMFAPLYDAYLPLVRRAGGVPRVIRLAPPHWRIDADLIAAAFTPATRLVILNNPLNPAGRVFDAAELALLAAACVAHDAIAISDEVWEHVVFDGRAHLPLMAQPGMRERTVKIGSAGKIFSLTGWKVGWIVAAPPLAQGIGRAHQFLTFTTPPNLQRAVAHGLGKEASWFAGQADGYARSRDRLAAGLADAGYAVAPSEGTYFLSIDLAASGIALDGTTFCERSVREAGVAAIPMGAFFPDGGAEGLVRLCFAKVDDTLDLAVERLGAFRHAGLR
jgi:aspartate/methionine/tyrosine aminotransferase